MYININSNEFNFQNLIFHKEDYFPDVIGTILKKYLNYLNKVNVDENLVTKVENFKLNIEFALLEYYIGQHGNSKFFFDEALKNINIENYIVDLNETEFFRARKINNARSYTKNEMFHIPYDKRFNVKTQRYSYPGLPCLYLSNSVECCSSELNSAKENLSFAKFKLKENVNLKVLNLCNWNKENKNEDDIFKIILILPLIICCSFYSDELDGISFNPCYILPQFLLEYIIDLNAKERKNTEQYILGIQYYSVKHLKSQYYDERYINYVFPTISSNKKNGFCDILKSIFEIEIMDLFRTTNRIRSE